MTVKEWLLKSRTMERELQQLREAKKKAYTLACGGTINSNQEKVQTSRQNTVEQKFAVYTEYSKQIDERVDRLIEYRGTMLKTINKLDNSKYRTLLIARYINCETWEKIAEDMNYDLRWVYEINKRAIKRLEEDFTPPPDTP